MSPWCQRLVPAPSPETGALKQRVGAGARLWVPQLPVIAAINLGVGLGGGEAGIHRVSGLSRRNVACAPSACLHRG